MPNYVTTFEQFLAGRKFDRKTLKLMKEAWNAAVAASEVYIIEMEGVSHGLGETFRAK